MTALGIDYGGTHTKFLLVSDEGEELARDTAPTGGIDELGERVERFVASSPADTFGLTIAGTLDAATGVVGRSANLPWLDGTAPAAALSQRLGIPGTAVQDGEAAALAEARLGAGRGSDDVFVVALGTGIAGAHVSRGSVRRGAHGAAGEVGHMRVATNGVLCSCGQLECLETAIGGHQLAARWVERGGSAAAGATAVDVVRAAAAGDEPARTALDDAARALGRAILEVSALVDPELIVIGGGLARSPEWTVRPAVERARASATFHTVPEIRLATLGVWAGARGAAEAVRRV
ncbi:MAG TPA: ROK family protein [Candidatus Microbacterium stercoravium]|uniref:ROK family protein n=1 Tax=Candidatus Microbacterium stercoravium TaxID=2838697 RepID=A0A9D2H6A1_9MICO|nr:ROK family protein [Candidatus Microbacterium stercoravium]